MSDEFLEFYINTHPTTDSQPLVGKNAKPKSKHPNTIIRHCDFCSNALPKRTKIYINICQDHAELKFCSRKCKEKWCYEK